MTWLGWTLLLWFPVLLFVRSPRSDASVSIGPAWGKFVGLAFASLTLRARRRTYVTALSMTWESWQTCSCQLCCYRAARREQPGQHVIVTRLPPSRAAMPALPSRRLPPPAPPSRRRDDRVPSLRERAASVGVVLPPEPPPFQPDYDLIVPIEGGRRTLLARQYDRHGGRHG